MNTWNQEFLLVKVIPISVLQHSVSGVKATLAYYIKTPTCCLYKDYILSALCDRVPNSDSIVTPPVEKLAGHNTDLNNPLATIPDNDIICDHQSKSSLQSRNSVSLCQCKP